MTTEQKRLVIVGATGMVGGYALQYALDQPGVAVVTSVEIGRASCRERVLRLV